MAKLDTGGWDAFVALDDTIANEALATSAAIPARATIRFNPDDEVEFDPNEATVADRDVLGDILLAPWKLDPTNGEGQVMQFRMPAIGGTLIHPNQRMDQGRSISMLRAMSSWRTWS